MILALVVLIAAVGVQSQETRYISDQLRVPLRKSACNSCAIIHSGLVAGTRLTVNKAENGWANVTTDDGLTGWLPEQYLVSEPVASDRLNAAEANARLLSEENADMKDRLATLEQEYDKLDSENTALRRQNEELETELLTVKRVSGNALALQEQNQELIKENRILQSEIDVLTATRDQLADNNSQRWFLYGGITVFLGALLAMFLPRLKPRKRFSEWA